MQEQRTLSPAEEDGQIDSTINILLLSRDKQRPWSVDEIEREVGNPRAVIDSLNRLYAYGLIHRMDGFVWATRAAIMSDEIRL